MAKNWCKIIEFETHDVLISKNWDNEEEKPTIVFSVMDEIKLDLTIGFDSEEEQENAFKTTIKEGVKDFLNDNLKQFSDIQIK